MAKKPIDPVERQRRKADRDQKKKTRALAAKAKAEAKLRKQQKEQEYVEAKYERLGWDSKPRGPKVKPGEGRKSKPIRDHETSVFVWNKPDAIEPTPRYTRKKGAKPAPVLDRTLPTGNTSSNQATVNKVYKKNKPQKVRNVLGIGPNGRKMKPQKPFKKLHISHEDFAAAKYAKESSAIFEAVESGDQFTKKKPHYFTGKGGAQGVEYRDWVDEVAIITSMRDAVRIDRVNNNRPNISLLKEVGKYYYNRKKGKLIECEVKPEPRVSKDVKMCKRKQKRLERKAAAKQESQKKAA